MCMVYYRVSTNAQDYESQKIGVMDYVKRSGLHVDCEYIDDGVSGTVPAHKRNLGKLLKRLHKGDLIVVSELSRLGRSTTDVINTCQEIANKGASCYMVKQGMCIDQTPVGKLMIAIFSAFAEMERDLICQRTREGLERIKRSGRKLGRAPGTHNKHNKLDGMERAIVRRMQHGWSINKIAKACGVSRPSIMRWCQRFDVIVHTCNARSGEKQFATTYDIPKTLC